MAIQNLSADAALASLKSSPEGLSDAAARDRLQTFGANRIEEVRRERAALRLLREFTHFFALILWLGALFALIADHFDPGQGMARLAAAIVGVILVNGLFSFWQEYRAERAVAALRRLLPQTVRALRGGRIVALPAEALVPGDIVQVEAGDIVPADCRVIAAEGLRVNTATVTGESLPKARQPGPTDEPNPLFANNLLLAGTAIVSGHARALVYATGPRTEFGRIARLTQTAGETMSPLQREIARLSRYVAVFATALGVIFFAVGAALGTPFWENMLFAIGIIVANVPEGLLPTVTLSLAMATQRMARRNALVRHLPAVEALGSTTVILSDKTGTLTRNRMTVSHLWLAGTLRPLDAWLSAPVRLERHRALFENMAVCHSLTEVVEGGSAALRGDPMEIALAETGRRVSAAAQAPARVAEIPFDTDRKRMSVVVQTAAGRVLYCKGALETVLPGCDRVQLDDAVAPLDDALRAQLLAAQEAMADRGLRVIAFAHRALDPGDAIEERAMVLDGLVGLEDPPRAEVPAAIARCAAAGIRVIMVTGDHAHTARAIAREIGLIRSEAPQVIDGETLRQMSPEALQLALDTPEILFARVAAEQKMRIVEALQRKGEIVAVTGDGVNDAPALKTADIGIAMGQSGTDVARAAADLVLLDDNFATIVAAIEEGRAVFDNIRKFLTYILTSNIPEIVPYLAFALFRIPLPLTVIQILAVDLGTDMLPALALGAERPDPAVMSRPPRRRGEGLLTWGLLARAYLFLGVLEAAGAMAVFFHVLTSHGWHAGQALAPLDPVYREATTACLATIVVMQVANALVCRHPHRPAFAFGLADNPLLVLGIAFELVLLLGIVYTPAGNALFGTAPLGLDAWTRAAAFAALLFIAEETRKAWLRARRST
jgi:calcium-translocating P-type ATPase